MIRGIGTSKGIGMGRALIVESPPDGNFRKKNRRYGGRAGTL